jgi:hypothetical protein
VMNTWLWWHDRNLPPAGSSTRMVFQPRIVVDRSCSRVMIMFTALVDSELTFNFSMKWLNKSGVYLRALRTGWFSIITMPIRTSDSPMLIICLDGMCCLGVMDGL